MSIRDGLKSAERIGLGVRHAVDRRGTKSGEVCAVYKVKVGGSDATVLLFVVVVVAEVRRRR